MDPVRLEVYRHRLGALCEEMGATLGRAAYSPNIKERRDYSCALFDAAGKLAAQAAHIPVHLGAMPLSVAAAIAQFAPAEGDVYLLNDPYAGGSHLPDWTIVAPVHHSRRLVAYLANRAHHADVGGLRAGSMARATEIHQEGLRIPPVRLVRGGVLDGDVERLLLANTRTPDERRGDLAAQLAALRVGRLRLLELIDRHGADEPAEAMAAVQAYTERILRDVLRAAPDGQWRFEDRLESADATLRVRLALTDAQAVIDLSDSDPQTATSLNAVRAVTLSAVVYCFACLLPPGVPMNDGCFRPLQLLTRPGTIVDAMPPAAVAAGNVETSQRIVDVVFGALAQALPEVVPAAGQGTMNNLLVGGRGEGGPFTYYETIGGGMGAGPRGDGLSGVQVHMTNTLNTPVEALEYAYPLRVERYELRRGTGGDGRHAGGNGIRRDVRALVDCDATILSERRERGPYGLAGGGSGAVGANIVIRSDGEQALPAAAEVRLRAGDVLSLRTPGGGGWGRDD